MLVVFVPLQFPLVWADLSFPVGITQECTDFDSDCALFTSETECGHPSQLRLHLSNLFPGLGSHQSSHPPQFHPPRFHPCCCLGLDHPPASAQPSARHTLGLSKAPAGTGPTSVGLGELSSTLEPLKALPQVLLCPGAWAVGRLGCETWMYSIIWMGSVHRTGFHSF